MLIWSWTWVWIRTLTSNWIVWTYSSSTVFGLYNFEFGEVLDFNLQSRIWLLILVWAWSQLRVSRICTHEQTQRQIVCPEYFEVSQCLYTFSIPSQSPRMYLSHLPIILGGTSQIILETEHRVRLWIFVWIWNWLWVRVPRSQVDFFLSILVEKTMKTLRLVFLWYCRLDCFFQHAPPKTSLLRTSISMMTLTINAATLHMHVPGIWPVEDRQTSLKPSQLKVASFTNVWHSSLNMIIL